MHTERDTQKKTNIVGDINKERYIERNINNKRHSKNDIHKINHTELDIYRTGGILTKRNIYAGEYMKKNKYGKNTQMDIYTDRDIHRLRTNGERYIWRATLIEKTYKGKYTEGDIYIEIYKGKYIWMKIYKRGHI